MALEVPPEMAAAMAGQAPGQVHLVTAMLRIETRDAPGCVEASVALAGHEVYAIRCPLGTTPEDALGLFCSRLRDVLAARG